MSITKGLVDLLQGTIDISSQPNVGTRITVVIPMQARHMSQPNADAQSKHAITKQEAIHILLVNDDELNLMIGQEILLEQFDLVDTATNGRDALALINQHPFDLVITDIQMPNMNGEQLRQNLATSHPDLPVLALTGNAYESDIERYRALGFNDVVTKPFKHRVLFNKINDVIRAKAS